MSSERFRERIEAWTRRGWLRPLDRSFADFLASLDPAADGLCLLAAALASHQLGRGHVCLDLAATLVDPDAVLSLPPEGEWSTPRAERPAAALAGLDLKDVRRALTASGLVSAGAGATPLVLDGERLYLRRYWEYERQVGEWLQARLTRAVPPPAELRPRLDALFPRREGAGPDWQKIACGLAAGGLLTLITGGPGTGKTYSVVRLLAVLQGAARERGRPLRIRLAAPTGKAAARLTESIGDSLATLPVELRAELPTEAETLHRLLGARPGTRKFRHGPEEPLHADLVVVDEASMIDLELMAALLGSLRPETRLVLLGDKDQLASVEAGSVLGDLCAMADQPGYRPETVAWIAAMTGEDAACHAGPGDPLAQRLVCLRESRRFQDNSGIGRLARAVNAGSADAVAEGEGSTLSGYPDLACIDLDALDELVLAGYRDYLETLRDWRPAPSAGSEARRGWAGRVLQGFGEFQVLCALRLGPWGVAGLNARIAATLLRAGLVPQTDGWYEGRPVLVTANDYGLGLMNGDIGVALRLPEEGTMGEDEARLRVVFRQPDGSLKRVLPGRLTAVETVYAMTVHKSQGSEFAHVALVLPDRPGPILTRELLYTGITRARHRLSLVLPNPAVLPDAVRRRVQRSGRLAEWGR